MMKLLLTYLLILIAASLTAQSIEKSVIGNAGGSMADGDISVGYTVGESTIGYIQNTYSIGQGFWAGNGFLIIPLNPSENENPLEILVYPNPVVEQLTVFTGDTQVYGITLFGVNGQQVLTQTVEPSKLEHKIDMSYITRGTYLLSLFVKDGNEEKQFKIIKN